MSLLEKYPKSRPKVSDELLKAHYENYKINRNGQSAATGISSKMERWMHHKTASDRKELDNPKTLEIGAGTLNHLEFEKSNIYDVIEPFKELYENSKYLNSISNFYNDISDIPNEKKYDRIISIAVFEHLTNLPYIIAKSCELLESDGNLRVAIPDEGGLLWYLGWKFTTGIEFKLKYKLDYGELMRYEHVNTSKEISELLKYFFEEIDSSFFGLSSYFCFYKFFSCKKPKMDIAKNYLNQLKNKSS